MNQLTNMYENGQEYSPGCATAPSSRTWVLAARLVSIAARRARASGLIQETTVVGVTKTIRWTALWFE